MILFLYSIKITYKLKNYIRPNFVFGRGSIIPLDTIFQRKALYLCVKFRSVKLPGQALRRQTLSP